MQQTALSYNQLLKPSKGAREVFNNVIFLLKPKTVSNSTIAICHQALLRTVVE